MGKHFTISFNDQMLFEADNKTIKDAGWYGLWTKADSVTHFHGLRINDLAK